MQLYESLDTNTIQNQPQLHKSKNYSHFETIPRRATIDIIYQRRKTVGEFDRRKGENQSRRIFKSQERYGGH